MVTEGGKRKVEEWSAADAETVDLSNVGTAEGMRGGVDPFSALEVEVVQIKEAEEAKKRLRALQGYRDGQFKDDYASSRLLRSKFRAEKKSLREGEARDQEVKDRLGVSIPLVAPDKSDADLAKAAMSLRPTRKVGARPKRPSFGLTMCPWVVFRQDDCWRLMDGYPFSRYRYADHAIGVRFFRAASDQRAP